MEQRLAASYRRCLALARSSGSNFYYAFLTLPRELFRDTCILYAYMRRTDDLGDDLTVDATTRRRRLAEWRDQLNEALAGKPSSDVLLAMADVAKRRDIPAKYLTDVIDGVERDLDPQPFETRAELERYCYQVAGVVGLCCIRIWGYSGEGAEERAVQCGLAFQLTNILRDVGEDALAGRTYLPRDELLRFHCSEHELKKGVLSPSLRQLMQYEVQQARTHYRCAEQLLENLTPPGRRILSAMLGIYGGLLHEIERRQYDVFNRRIELPAWKKWLIVARALCR